jgi:hypothetical protein
MTPQATASCAFAWPPSNICPLTPANQGLLSLAAQHPNAYVDANPQHTPGN